MRATSTTIHTRQIDIDGTRINYLVNNKSAVNTIFFIHGNSGSAKTWMNQLEYEGFNKYRLIAIDLPAHGDSSADEALRYGVMDFATLLVKVVDELSGGYPYILVGFSLGANVVGEMLAFPIKPTGLIFLGPTLIGDESHLGNIFLPELDMRIMFSERAEDAALHELFDAALHMKNPTALNNLVNDFNNVKPQFRPTVIARAAEGNISNEFEMLRQCNIPALIVFGKNEKMVNPFYLEDANIPKWKNNVYKVDNAGHYVYVDQPQKVNELIADYAYEVFINAHA